MEDNRFEKTSELYLRAINKNGKTRLMDCYFTAPFKIAKPFYKGEEMKLILMSASAGIIEGDRQVIHIVLEEGTNVYFTNQSYEKLYKMEKGCASRKVQMKLGKNTSLSYVPLCTIPFAESSFQGTTDIHLEDETSKIFFTELFAAGRKAHGENFKYKCYSSITNIWQGEKLIYRDNTYYEPEKMQLDGYGMFEGNSHLINIVLINEKEPKRLLVKIREYIEEEALEGGASLSEACHINIKVLGQSAQELEKIVEHINLLRR